MLKLTFLVENHENEKKHVLVENHENAENRLFVSILALLLKTSLFYGQKCHFSVRTREVVKSVKFTLFTLLAFFGITGFSKTTTKSSLPKPPTSPQNPLLNLGGKTAIGSEGGQKTPLGPGGAGDSPQRLQTPFWHKNTVKHQSSHFAQNSR